MSEAFKLLYQGLIEDAPGQLVQVPSGKQMIIKHMQVVNSDSTYSHDFWLWVNGTNPQNLYLPRTSLLPGGYGSFEGTLTLDASKTIYAEASTSNKVAISLYGMEVSA